MNQPQDKMRAEFEAHMLKLKPCAHLGRQKEVFGGYYRTITIQRNWELWQAACAQQSAQSQQDAMDAARSNGISWDSGFLTVVYRGVEPGPEAQELCAHPKVSAMSWSHAINDRDEAIEREHAR